MFPLLKKETSRPCSEGSVCICNRVVGGEPCLFAEESTISEGCEGEASDDGACQVGELVHREM